MNKVLYDYLKEFKFDDGEIMILFETAPVLEETPIEKIADNISVLISAGFPADDMGTLIAQNPKFLTRNTSELKFDVENLLNASGDLEDVLKNDPFAI